MIYVILEKAKPYMRRRRGRLEFVRGYVSREATVYPPEQEAEGKRVLDEYLSGISKMMPVREGWAYSGFEHFVKENGRFYTPRALPTDVSEGKIKDCFMNAWHLATERKDLTYVEGYAIGTAIIPVLHAWCVDKNGNVIDPTWGTAKAYYGVSFPTDFVIKTAMSRKKFGIIDNMEEGFPLMRSKIVLWPTKAEERTAEHQKIKETLERHDSKPEKKNIVSSGGYQFVIPDRAKKYSQVVMVNVEKFDQEWGKDESFYISEAGSNEISNRRARFREFLATGEAIEMPEVSARPPHLGDSTVGFTNGRHRFAVLRDLGLKVIPMAVDKKSVPYFKEKFSALEKSYLHVIKADADPSKSTELGAMGTVVSYKQRIQTGYVKRKKQFDEILPYVATDRPFMRYPGWKESGPMLRKEKNETYPQSGKQDVADRRYFGRQSPPEYLNEFRKRPKKPKSKLDPNEFMSTTQSLGSPTN